MTPLSGSACRSLTDDGEGPIEAVSADLPTEAQVLSALRELVGTFDQRPPVFSARKQGGRTAHRAARAGSPLDVPPRTVTVHGIEPLGLVPGDGWLDVRIDVRCGPGTYIRSLARDIGERLGCGGYLASLRRTEAGGLSVADALTPETLEAMAADGRLSDAVRPVAPLLSLPHLILSDAQAGRFTHGSVVPLSPPAPADGRQAVFRGDDLLGVGTVRDGMLQPDKVVAAEAGA